MYEREWGTKKYPLLPSIGNQKRCMYVIFLVRFVGMERERERYTHMLENEGHLRGGWDVYSICFLFNFPAYIT